MKMKLLTSCDLNLEAAFAGDAMEAAYDLRFDPSLPRYLDSDAPLEERVEAIMDRFPNTMKRLAE